MFYAQFILAKKGPLAKIWLAAHWESKLSKAQIQETDLSNAAHEIAKPKVKIALRTCGYLLLGLMRIYRKKGYFLYNDCKEAVLRIKTNLNPDKINWEKDEEHVAEAIGPDGVMPDFDVTVVNVDISELNHPNFEQIPIDQITLNENDFIEPEMPQLGLDDFGEVAAGLVAVEEPFNRSVVEGARDASRANDLSILNHPDVDLMEEGVSNSSKAMDMGQFEFGTDLELDKMFNQPPLESTRISDEIGNELPVATQDSFALEPIDENQELVIAKKAPARHKRKRKLIVDELNSISNEEMMTNIRNYSDITHDQVDLAPPTKNLMKIRQIGTTEKIFSMPATEFLHESIFRIYSSHISVYKAMPPEKRPMHGPDQEDVDMISSIGDGSRVSEFSNMRMSAPSFGFEPEDDEFQLELPPLDLREDDYANPAIENLPDYQPLSPEPMPLSDKDNLLQDISNRILDSQPLDSDVLDNISVADLISQSPARFNENFNPNRNREEQADAMLEPATPGTYAKKRKAGMEFADDESEFDPNELRFTRQTQTVFDNITLRLKNSEATSLFSIISKKSTQKTAAQRLYSILVLAKHNAIHVEQTIPYADVKITKGADYQKCLTRVDEFRK